MRSSSASDLPRSAGPDGDQRAWSSPPRVPGWAAQAVPVPAMATLRVLVVDDDPVNLLLMTAHMAPWGLAPWLAADGAEAVVCACAVPFDLILMDLQMPVLDGLGATSAIRRFEAQQGRAAVPVVAYSSACVAAPVLAAHGLNGSLDKPCTARSLKACLLQWCVGLDEASASDSDRQRPDGPALPSLPGLAHRTATGRHNVSPR